MPSPPRKFFLVLVAVALAVLIPRSCVFAEARLIPGDGKSAGSEPERDPGECVHSQMQFVEVPDYRNVRQCADLDRSSSEFVCDPRLIRVAMTLDLEYLRGTMAAVHSVLKHASCPENIFFHFVASSSNSSNSNYLKNVLRTTFPSLRSKVYEFDQRRVSYLISPSIRRALENPLNYARNYLAEMFEPCVGRVMYLDSDIIVVDDILKLWRTPLSGSGVIGAPEYCHANFTKYFTEEFWSDPELPAVFKGMRPCYFNTGVMVMDLSMWRDGDYTRRIEGWMEVQKERRIYELGSLPPFLLVFGGDVTPIDRRWNQHGLGGDNVSGSCRTLHPGPVSLLHWSGKVKPWARLDTGEPCPVDYFWMPYDLHKPGRSSRWNRVRSYHDQQR